MEEAYDTRPTARLWDGEYSDSDTEEGEPPKEWNQRIDITELRLMGVVSCGWTCFGLFVL